MKDKRIHELADIEIRRTILRIEDEILEEERRFGTDPAEVQTVVDRKRRVIAELKNRITVDNGRQFPLNM